MSLLRSVIADARQRKSISEFPDSSSVATGWKNRELSWDTPGSEGKPSDTPAQTSRLSSSFPGEKSTGKLIGYEAPGLFRLDNSIAQDIKGSARNSEQAHPLSVPEEIRATNPGHKENRPAIPGEESHLTISTDDFPDPDTYSGNNQVVSHRVSDSMSFPENTEEVPGKKESTDDVNAMHLDKENVSQSDKHKLIKPVADKNTSTQEGLTIINSCPQSSEEIPEKKVTANELKTIPDENESAGLPEKFELQLSAAKENTPDRGEFSDTIAADKSGYTKGSMKSSVGLMLDSMGGNEPQQGVVDSAQPNRVPSGIDKRADSKLPLSPQDNRQPQKKNRDISQVIVDDDQLVSSQAPAKDLHKSSDEKLSPILQNIIRQESTQANSPAYKSSNPPASVTSKTSNSLKKISRPSSSSANSEFLSSVHAKSIQSELMPKNTASFHAGSFPRPPEKKYETPKVQIGQIDVIIEAAAQPADKQAQATSPIDLSSRHYLRRL